MLRAQNAIRGLQSWQELSRSQLTDHAHRLQTSHSEIRTLQFAKQDANAFEEERGRLDREIMNLKMEAEAHGNHFAMVENFVEKYIPVRI